MQYIKDYTGDEWTLDLNLGVAEELDAFLQSTYTVDLFNAVETMALLARPINVVSIASCLCREQREKKGLSPADFGRRWKGEAAYKLQRALWSEYRDFFPSPEIGALIDSTMKRLQSLSESEGRLVKQAMDRLAKTMDDALAEMEATIGPESST